MNNTPMNNTPMKIVITLKWTTEGCSLKGYVYSSGAILYRRSLLIRTKINPPLKNRDLTRTKGFSEVSGVYHTVSILHLVVLYSLL